MTAGTPRPTAGTPRPQVDTGKPHPARVYDYMLGGKDHYEVDREVGEKLPDIAKRSARLNRAFMHRAATWLAHQGIDQFLDIGTGIPTEPNLHQVVQAVNPRARVAYVDNDPIVLRHAEALLVGAPEGATDFIQADVRNPEAILEHAREFLDFDRPLSLSLIALLHFIPDDQDPYGITRTLVGALPKGSYLTFSHGTYDFYPELKNRIAGAYGKGAISLQARTKEEIEPFFEGLDLVAPGLVTAAEWHKDTPAPEYTLNGMYAAVAAVR